MKKVKAVQVCMQELLRYGDRSTWQASRRCPKADKAAKTDKAETPEKAEKPEKPEKAAKGKAGKAEKADGEKAGSRHPWFKTC